jgi:hypothetical protein
MKPGQSATIRFLPDLADSNPRGFLVEKTTHVLMIAGEKKTVPCLSAFEEDCPICKLSQSHYKNEDKINGKKYWRKKSYIAQALIVEDSLPPNKDTGESHQGQVRYIALGFQLYNIIKAAFADDVEPLESVPYDLQDGYDFIIKKSMKGDYADYSVGTKFKNKQRSLTEDELATAGENMIDLSTLLPKHPGTEKVQAMLNAELNGEQYNDKSGSSSKDDGGFSTPAIPKVEITTAIPKVESAHVVEAQTPAASTDSSVDDMLAAIRQRRKAAA